MFGPSVSRIVQSDALIAPNAMDSARFILAAAELTVSAKENRATLLI
jgi:hypothetical protein